MRGRKVTVLLPGARCPVVVLIPPIRSLLRCQIPRTRNSVDSASAGHYDTDMEAKAEIEQLMKINQQQLAILRELQSLSGGSGRP
ncbi:MAG: hypothetical protein QOH40_120 [Arthrobacter pascens]|nr:hypothetical protein [Arthrobacter pascens]